MSNSRSKLDTFRSVFFSKRFFLILLFKARTIFRQFKSIFRKTAYQMCGFKIGKNTTLPRCRFTWPHKVLVGDRCVLEENIYFKHDGPYSHGRSIIIGDDVFIGVGVEFNIRNGIFVGNDCLIASGCKFIDHDHGFATRDFPLRVQSGVEREIVIENDVWIGANAVILKGVRIGRGAIIGAGALVTKSVSPYEIWTGVPARKTAVRPRGRHDSVRSSA